MTGSWKMHLSRCFLPAMLLILFGMLPASAVLTTIQTGGTVFIGEEGLDITETGAFSGDVLVWFGPGGKTTDVPAATVTVGDPADFYVSPAAFSGKTGPWFLEPSRNLAFYVQEPTLELRVVDETAGFEVSKSVTWIPAGDVVSFRITTDLWVMSQRPGVAGAPVTIRVQGPTGVKYSSMSGYSLEEIPVSSSPFSTGGIWNTGSSEYAKGDYSVWAECNANRMMDNYLVEGGTRSTPVTFVMQSVNPLITSSLTPTTTTASTTIPTTIATTATAMTSPTTVPVTTPPETTVIQTPVTTPPTIPPTTATPGFEGLCGLAALAAVFLFIRGARK